MSNHLVLLLRALTARRKMLPIIIPAYEPDNNLIDLLGSLQEAGIRDIIIVNDGSGKEYAEIFEKSQAILDSIGGIILTHERNQGKGRALKTAFTYVSNNYKEAVGVITADSDGQHDVDSILSIKKALVENQKALILGVRQFDADDIPWKSKFGNGLTRKISKLATGRDISDTQTGLRGIPAEFLEKIVEIDGERFEYEMRVLMYFSHEADIIEVPIKTIYDSKDNHSTHFNPIKDSIRIYRIFFEKFLKYIAASLSSFVIDIGVFSLLCYILKPVDQIMYITYSTVAARIISSLYNYTVNKILVFKNKKKVTTSIFKYIILVVVQMLLSAGFVTLFVNIFLGVPESIIKMVVDTILFFISYQVQNRLVFR